MIQATPPMGWNSWNTFGSDISEQLILEMAECMVKDGYLAAGYNYLVIDDCWSLRERDAEGRLVPDPAKFPNGMKALADRIHAYGLKFGMYSCAGHRTCADYPGSYGHEFLDAETFASWGVDFLKYDYCYKPSEATGEMLYRRMGMALRASGRDILFSACNWGHDESWRWMRSAGAHMYRSTGDIFDRYNSFIEIARSQEDKLGYSGHNCFNDLDMLIVGMFGQGNVAQGGCRAEEYRSHFALWCLFGTPLMIGADLRRLDADMAALLKNPRLLAINQDPETRPPYLVGEVGGPVYCRHLADGRYALGFFNLADEKRGVHLLLTDAGLPAGGDYGFRMTDCFSGEVGEAVFDHVGVELEAHDCRLYLAELVKKDS